MSKDEGIKAREAFSDFERALRATAKRYEGVLNDYDIGRRFGYVAAAVSSEHGDIAFTVDRNGVLTAMHRECVSRKQVDENIEHLKSVIRDFEESCAWAQAVRADLGYEGGSDE